MYTRLFQLSSVLGRYSLKNVEEVREKAEETRILWAGRLKEGFVFLYTGLTAVVADKDRNNREEKF